MSFLQNWIHLCELELVSLKQYNDAEKIYQEVLAKEPWDWYARLKVAQTYWLEGRRKEAFTEAIKIFRYLDFRK